MQIFLCDNYKSEHAYVHIIKTINTKKRTLSAYDHNKIYIVHVPTLRQAQCALQETGSFR